MQSCSKEVSQLVVLEIYVCSQGIEEPTRVTHYSEVLIDHIIPSDYRRPLEFRVIQTYTTDLFSTYDRINVKKSQSIRSQHFIRDRPFLRDSNAKNLYLIHLNHRLEHADLGHDINTCTERFANAILGAVNALIVKKISKLQDVVRLSFTREI